MAKIKYTLEKLKEEALKYKTRNEFKNKNYPAYTCAQKRKLLDIVCSHMPKRIDKTKEKHPNFKYTDEILYKEALKYKTRKEFRNNSFNMYSAAKNRKILKKICFHMNEARNSRWTDEELQQEALKHNIRDEFRKNNNGAYVTACSRRILDKICSHMKISKGTSSSEIELFNVIKSFYPSTKKMKDCKVKIKNKLHIKGFDIDIYIPELKLGIEFDGKYWHSFEGLKRTRIDWPDKDIKNYHQIKDDYFLSKGIQILHIKEENWLKDKEDCIKKCFNFLELDYKIQSFKQDNL